MSTKELESVRRKHGQPNQAATQTNPRFMDHKPPDGGWDHHDHQHQREHGCSFPRQQEQGQHPECQQVWSPIPMNNGRNGFWHHHGIWLRKRTQQLNGVHVEHDRGKASIHGRKDLVERGVVKCRCHGREHGEKDGKVGDMDIWGRPAERRIQVEQHGEGKAWGADSTVELGCPLNSCILLLERHNCCLAKELLSERG